jgi:Asp-tRNA(Asn)/Glu-tRNA(Gln) amidotransferase A subunit family amidase
MKLIVFYTHLVYVIFVGEPISVLDGVPVAIKDEIDCLPYPTTGTAMS